MPERTTCRALYMFVAMMPMMPEANMKPKNCAANAVIVYVGERGSRDIGEDAEVQRTRRRRRSPKSGDPR